MTFQELDHPEALKVALAQASIGKAVFFKHSNRCSISRMVENRLLNYSLSLDGIPFYWVEVVKSREVSNALALQAGVKHESPQILIFDRGQCIHSWSHNAIIPQEIEEALTKQTGIQG